MNNQFDFKKEWEKTKKQLMEFGREATKIAQRGEKELVKFSEKSVLHIDATAANLRKEKLFYQIGKEYVNQLRTKKESTLLKKLLDELDLVEKEGRVLKRKISLVRKTAPKKVTAPDKNKKTPAKKSGVE
jgi:hypothetical protein